MAEKRLLTATEHPLVSALAAKLDEPMRLRVMQDLELSLVEDVLPDKCLTRLGWACGQRQAVLYRVSVISA